jgi:hypothetical protein
MACASRSSHLFHAQPPHIRTISIPLLLPLLNRIPTPTHSSLLTYHTVALHRIRSTEASSKVNFTIKYLPYQLYPGATQEGEDKYAWYKKSKYGDSEEKMKMYTTLMTAYGASAGIDFKFGGTVANTLQAHRVIQYFQEKEGPEVADKLVMNLYKQYFEEERHPSSKETLLRACKEAGVEEKLAKSVVDDEYEGLQETKVRGRSNPENSVSATNLW